VLNAFGELSLMGSARLFVNVQNLMDSAYIVARAPAGARPGLPRTLMAGIKFRLGS
jgi:Fe(3+) dicitrate transport protein